MNPTAASRLTEHLSAHRSPITDAWIQAVKEDREITSSKKLTRAELADHLPVLFKDLIDYLESSGAK